MTEADERDLTQEEEAANIRGKRLRGCGCLTGLCILGLGILIVGDFDATAWASALSAIVLGFLTFSLSGVNGMWENK
jgi:hypothetical protein